ncbi:FAD-binding oxidoreductase [Streptomyces violens]|uniref:FAD-binding oxidoreductase n=1 Tax=Streptomyces violens TaxID=66377 RepID=UPI0004C1D12A|nr:FAD-binding oxidoreductase [Streptomyces violens]
MSGIARRGLLSGGAAALAGAAGAGIGGMVRPYPAAAASRSKARAGAVPGRPVVVTPHDARYPDLVRGNNRRWTGSPGAVHLVSSTDQVVDAVRDGVRDGRRLAVRSGGHCYEDFVFNPDVETVIDMSEMRAVYYDEDRSAFVVEAGATLFDVYLTLYRLWGVTLPGGLCHYVGAGGHLSGGGYGMLSRLYGLTVDHVYGVEAVVTDGKGGTRSVVATRDADDPNRDLWWAHTGGGGGNFGIVTRYFLRTPGTAGRAPAAQLPKPPAEVLLHDVSWRWSDLSERSFHRLLQNYGTWLEGHSDPDSPYAGLYSSLNLSTVASGEISLSTQFDATVPDAERLLERYLNALTEGVGAAARPASVAAGELRPSADRFAPRRSPWLLATRNTGAYAWTRSADYKSAHMRTGFPDDQIAAIHRHLRSAAGGPGDLLQAITYGGRINAVRPGATAVAQRDSVLKLQYQCYWEDPAEEARKVSWLREFYGEVYAGTGGVPVPGEVTDGCYVNYADVDLSDPRWNTSDTPWHELYYKDGYARLQQVKQRWDPSDTFRHGQSVRLPAG